MASFSIENFGCRATQADAAAIERQFLEKGFARTRQPAAADVVVLNTCTVTAAADMQARDAIRHIHHANPAAQIIVTGCYAQRDPEELAALEGVVWVVGNSHQHEIAGLLGGSRPTTPSRPVSPGFVPLAHLDTEPLSLARGPAKILTSDIFEMTTVQVAPVEGCEGERTRPILKIQDGCNNRCAYCVIPQVRGRSRSLSPATVLEEIRRLADAGSREIVLSGINLGAYGRDLSPRVELGELIARVLGETPLQRLRLSSIEPMDVTQDLVDRVASTGRIARHFHIPLQSGSDRILRSMHRWYRAAHFARRIELIHERLSDAAIGGDVIVGFPGETEEDFRATVDFIAALPFTYLHVFAFSARPGTKATGMAGNIPLDVIKQRARELRALGAAKSAWFRAAHAGSTQRALTLHHQGLHKDDAWTEALTGNYLKVRVAGKWPANLWFDVRIPADDFQPAATLAL